MVLALMTYIFTNVCDVHQKGMPNERWNVYWIGCWIMIWFNTGTVANMFSTKSKGTIIIIIIKDAVEPESSHLKTHCLMYCETS